MLVGGHDSYLAYSPRHGTLRQRRGYGAHELRGYRDDRSVLARATPLRDPPAPLRAEPIQWPEIILGGLLEPAVWRHNISISHNDSPAKERDAANGRRRSLAGPWRSSDRSARCSSSCSPAVDMRSRCAKRHVGGDDDRAAPVRRRADVLAARPARRRACPVCGRKRVVTRERCEHCGSPFAPPRRDGTELIEVEMELVG